MIRGARTLAARFPPLLAVVQEFRSRATLRRYVRVRERYVRAAPRALSPEGRAEARRELSRRWAGPRRVLTDAREARLFCASPRADWASTFTEEVQRAFDCEAIDVSPYLPPDPQEHDLAWRTRLQRDLIEAFAAGHATRPFDLAFLYLHHFHLIPETIHAIASTGVPVAVLSADDKHTYLERPGHPPSGTRPLVQAATVCLTTSIECLRWYAADGGVGYYFPVAADPAVFRHLDIEKDIDVSFVGGRYGGRRRLISRLQALGIRVECFGPMTERGPVPREEMVRIFNRTRVNLGFGGIGEAEGATTLKSRDFEVPMTGNAYLTTFDHQLAALFRVGDEIACYRNEVDCVEQIRMLLEDTGAAERLGAAGRRRALAEHTWTRRVADLLRWLGVVRDR